MALLHIERRTIPGSLRCCGVRMGWSCPGLQVTLSPFTDCRLPVVTIPRPPALTGSGRGEKPGRLYRAKGGSVKCKRAALKQRNREWDRGLRQPEVSPHFLGDRNRRSNALSPTLLVDDVVRDPPQDLLHDLRAGPLAGGGVGPPSLRERGPEADGLAHARASVRVSPLRDCHLVSGGGSSARWVARPSLRRQAAPAGTDKHQYIQVYCSASTLLATGPRAAGLPSDRPSTRVSTAARRLS